MLLATEPLLQSIYCVFILFAFDPEFCQVAHDSLSSSEIAGLSRGGSGSLRLL